MTITAHVIADSISLYGQRLTTFELRYPRFIHAEFMTHRVLARNASSSRATPIAKVLEDIQRDPAMPVRWGLNGYGMQDHGEMTPEGEAEAKRQWLRARDSVLAVVGRMMAQPEVPHKQIINRLLEPWAHIKVVATATEWANFFALRRHKDAQPEIKVLADEMWRAIEASEPRELDVGEWHLPYILPEDPQRVREYLDADQTAEDITRTLIQMSAARCARVSYYTFGKKLLTEVITDVNTYRKLVGSHPVHASPTEHQATPDGQVFNTVTGQISWKRPELHGPFNGWCQHRKTIPGENITEYAG